MVATIRHHDDRLFTEEPFANNQNDTYLQGRTPNRVFGSYVLLVEVLYRAMQDGPKPFYSDVYYFGACGERLGRAGAAQADDKPSTSR